jgi:protein-tyrosine phosphatase
LINGGSATVALALLLLNKAFMAKNEMLRFLKTIFSAI